MKTFSLIKITFETKSCGRCGGSGHYSYCSMYGTTCFKCGGSGKELTLKGRKASAAFDAVAKELRSVPASEIKVGDKILHNTLSGRNVWATVASVKPSLTKGYSVTNGVKTEYEYLDFDLTFKGKTLTGFACPTITMIQKSTPWTQELVDKINSLKGATAEWKEVEG